MTEFKTALDQLGKLTVEDQVIYWLSCNEGAIRRAFLIADRLMQEPSEGMIKECVDAEFGIDAKHLSFQEIFKAMRDQLIREVELEGYCFHSGYSFKEHGRCCPQCGEFLTGFGD